MQADNKFKNLLPGFWIAKPFGFQLLIRPIQWNFCHLPSQTSRQKISTYLLFIFHLQKPEQWNTNSMILKVNVNSLVNIAVFFSNIAKQLFVNVTIHLQNG